MDIFSLFFLTKSSMALLKLYNFYLETFAFLKIKLLYYFQIFVRHAEDSCIDDAIWRSETGPEENVISTAESASFSLPTSS